MLVLEYKAKANKAQYQAIEESIKTTQFVRNKCLRYWMDSSKEDSINNAAISRYSTVLRANFPFVAALNSMAVQAAAERAWLAISRFYDNCKKAKPGKKGFPRFQHDNRSVEYKTSGWSLHPTKRRITFTDKKGIGELKLMGKWDIHTHPVKSVKRVRIVRRADGYYVQFCVDVECKETVQFTGQEIGLDFGLEHFYTDSNGYHEPNPRFLRKTEKQVKHVQRRIYKKEKGKNGRKKARNRYARKHLKISRQRTEHAKSRARHVMRSNDLCVYENLQVKNMVRNHHLAKSINDAGWRQFRSYLEYFAQKYRKVALAVEPHYTSQECPKCGTMVKKSLSTRTHTCKCGCVLQRDYAAAINILRKGKEKIATSGHGESKPTSKKKARNARGVGSSTHVGANLHKQLPTLSLESHGFL
ncbi:transposase [Tolypothrix campylonemoides VB511288]|nr:transposase [Tolypothrix campylonemoides VB511288]KAB8316119.1 transposase [Tolypothrix campylonemoides VB511288]KAB8316897.1 transposase [Tolypothrix campylonemoides VB511288]KAB8316902.1 transposase [Tolypothrix campylonemoides VB511288]KAB8317465.1 transposase [Tolypothrix campylonemoides VB511288]